MIEIRRTSRGKFYYLISGQKSKTYTTRQKCVKGLRSLRKNTHNFDYDDGNSKLVHYFSGNYKLLLTVSVPAEYRTMIVEEIEKVLAGSRYVYQGITYKL